MAHHTDSSGTTYADTAFLNSVGRVRGVTLQHMGFGEFYADTPKGRVDFDRMRGKDFPGQSGRSHKVYGPGADWLVQQMERGNHSEKMATAGRAASEDHLRSATIRLASTLPKGSAERKVLLAALVESEEKMSFAAAAQDVGERTARLRSATIRLASTLPKGSSERRQLLSELKEARGRDWKKEIIGERVRIRWTTGGMDATLVVEELPGKPFKRRLRRAEFNTGRIEHFLRREGRANNTYLFLMENLTDSAMFSKSMNYDRAVMAFRAAIDSAYEQIGEDAFDRWMVDSIKKMPQESEVYFLEVEPGDYSPIDTEGKDFRVVSEWTEGTIYPLPADEYMAQMEGMRAFYKIKSAGGARKLYKLVTGLTKAGELSRMSLEQFKKLLDKNKIAYRYVPTVWR